MVNSDMFKQIAGFLCLTNQLRSIELLGFRVLTMLHNHFIVHRSARYGRVKMFAF